MKEKYIEESGSEIDEASDIAIRLKVLAGELYNAQANLEWLKRQMFVSSAGGEYLDYIAMQRGITRKSAAKSKGKLTFRVNDTLNYAIIIPQGTVVATDGEIPVRVCTVSESVIPPATYSVTVDAEAEQPGYSGNIPGGSAVVPVNVPAGIDSVTNYSVFSGGDDEESDNTLRERIKKTFTVQPNGTNAAYYEQLALSVDGVGKAGVIEKYGSVGNVGVFVCGKDNDISDETVSKVKEIMNEKRAVGSTVLVSKAARYDYDLTVTVTAKAGYEESDVKEMIETAFTDYIGSIPLGGKLYLSTLGKYLLDTDCIENYEFSGLMQNKTIPASQYFAPGDVYVEVN